VGEALAVMDGDTRVIPGHGTLSGRDDLQAYRDALVAMRSAVAERMEAGMTLEEIQAARPIRAQAEAWAQDRATEDTFVATLHHGIREAGR
jgi:hypothetical protein